jgi:phosphate butyryltransferase
MNIPGYDLHNHLWSELQIGDEASIDHTITARDLYLFAHASGNLNPNHMPHLDVAQEGSQEGVAGIVAPSMWIGALISSVLGNILPGPGTSYRKQSLDFVGHAQIGDQLKIYVKLIEKLESPKALFATEVSTSKGEIIATGIAEVDAPLEKITLLPDQLPGLLLGEHNHFERIIKAAQNLPPMPTAVVCPDDTKSLGGALMAMHAGLILPILLGSREAIEAAANEANADIREIEIIDIADHKLAAATAVALVHQNRVKAIMKGNVHSDELLSQVVKKDGGLRGAQRISHVFVLNVPTLSYPLFISDAAINIAPDLATKVDITQNAIDLACACGIALPHVAILSAVETVNFNIPSSMDAAILAKMADRGQILGGLVDGPLAMDNAIDLNAAQTKHISSPVAGKAQVLIVPNLEAGNMLVKQLTFISHAQPAGLVLGAKVPVMLTSRADSEHARMASCALALLYDAYRQNGASVFAH